MSFAYILDSTSAFLKYFWVKLCLTLPIGLFVLNEQHYLIIYALLFILILDTILGIWVSIRYKVFTSHRLARVTTKLARYTIGLASIWGLVCVSPSIFGWAFNSFGTFFILTEVFSNFEKLSLLGLTLPTKLLSRLNKNFRDYNSEDKVIKKQAISKILSKNDANYTLRSEDIHLKNM